MLNRLEIKNYVLIDSLSIDFKSGFCAISGETGSGKSIILGALGLILGEKCKSDIVRLGQKEAIIEACFSYRKDSLVDIFLKENEIDDDDNLLIKRIIRSSGRSLCYINDFSVTTSELESLGSILVDVSSQHAHQSLVKSDMQRFILDKCASNTELLSIYKEKLKDYDTLVEEIAKIKAESEKNKANLDYISFCLNELEEAELIENEDEELKVSINKISSIETISLSITAVLSSLRGDIQKGAIEQLNFAKNSLDKASKIDEELLQYTERILSASLDLEDISLSLRDYIHSLTYSADVLDQMSSRLSVLQRIKKKYGPSIIDAIKKRENYKLIIENIDNSDILLKQKENELKVKLEHLSLAANKLTESRKKAAIELSSSIINNLKDLGMSKAIFEIDIEEVNFNSHGKDKITFFITSNLGSKRGEIKNIASGGELSRIMLAIKSSLSLNDDIETLLFDEVDAGLGGETALSVAHKLRLLSTSHQVITITHLAQIAAKADYNLVVIKKEKYNRAFTTIECLDKKERVKEIARLLSGDITALSLTHASSLLKV